MAQQSATPMGDIEMRPADAGIPFQQEDLPPLIAPSSLPPTIRYEESVKAKLNKRHDKEFIRREESRLHELIATLPEVEI